MERPQKVGYLIAARSSILQNAFEEGIKVYDLAGWLKQFFNIELTVIIKIISPKPFETLVKML